MRNISYVLITALLVAAPASADDSSAALELGGIVFTKNTPVRMAAEDLYVSPKAVRIRFSFANDTGKDVDTVVAFPLPDIDNEGFYFEPLGATTDDPQNFVGFKVSVNGKPTAFKVEQRAFVKARDVTAIVEAAGLPLNVVIGGNTAKLDALPPAKRKQLIAEGVLADDTPSPLWTVRTKFYWTQRFPAHKTVVIEHSYQPVTGQSFFSGDDVTKKDATGGRDYCFDAPTKVKITAMAEARKKTASENGEYLNAAWTDYILKTANNWNGPIGRFHLTLDKLKPDNVLSLCWDGELKKTGPTTFESVRTNFSPKQDIHMLVLE